MGFLTMVGNFAKAAVKETSKHAPTILMVMGTAGVSSAVIFSAKAAPKAEILVEDAETEKGEELTVWEHLKTTAPVYWPAVLTLAGGLGCFWFAHHIDVKRGLIYASLYSASEEALKEYKRKVIEVIGEKKEKEVRDDIAKDHVTANPPALPQGVVLPEEDYMCVVDGQYFRSNYVRIKRAENEANSLMINSFCNYISKTELFDLLDETGTLHKNAGRDAAYVGWCVDKMLMLEITPIFDASYKPVLYIEFKDQDGMDYPAKPGFSSALHS